MGVDAAGGEDHAFAGDHFGGTADGDGAGRVAVRVPRFAARGDASAFQADVGFNNAPGVDDQRVGDYRVDHVGGAQLTLAHAVADDLAAAELHLVAVGGEVLFDLDPQVGIGQTHLVADGGAEHVGVGLAGNLHQSAPMMRPAKPNTRRSPARSTSSTSRDWPGSKRTAVPAAIFRRIPRAAARSKLRASLVSKK